jgi:XTP/dITP diphosphohydrolase
MEIFLGIKEDYKIKEIKEILKDSKINFVTKNDFNGLPDVNEDRNTLKANALKKARRLCGFSRLPTIAEDSGLVVKELNGEPGVKAVKYAKEGSTPHHNNQKLIKALEDIEDEKRDAYFMSMVAYVSPEGHQVVMKGTCNGKILKTPQCESQFAYENLFQVEGYNKTFAELDTKIKNKISHRAQALNKVKQFIFNK